MGFWKNGPDTAKAAEPRVRSGSVSDPPGNRARHGPACRVRARRDDE